MESNLEQPGFAPDTPTDGRKKGDWESKYPDGARNAILFESIYLGVIFFLTPSLFFMLTNNGYICSWRNEEFLFAWLGGTFGGVLFSIKWLYHSVAKNIWNKDRRLWRIFTPHISGGLSFAMIVLISSGLVNVFNPSSLQEPDTVFGMGFLIGYFSDAAIGKLSEVANTFFGATEKASTAKAKPQSE